MTDLAIIIVNWNVRDLLAGCLRSVQADLTRSNLSAQIWVVDNASTDGSVKMLQDSFPDIRLIASDQNLGFGAGNNAALRAIGFTDRDRPPQPLAAQPEPELPQAVLLLNPDTKLHPGALPILFNFLTGQPQAGIAGAQLLYGDGSFQHSVFDFPGLWQLAIELLPVPGRLVESRLNGRYPRSRYQAGQPFKVGHPLGAAMAVRREAIEQVGLLDEQYHMYVEEVDWSRRIVMAGWEAYCVPAAKVTHFGGQSTGQMPASSFINLWTSRGRFYRKHYTPLKVWLAGQIVRLGMRRLAAQAARAAQRGELDRTALAEQLQGYAHVSDIWRHPQINKLAQEQKKYV